MNQASTTVIQMVKKELMLANLSGIWPLECSPRLHPLYRLFLGDDLKKFKESLKGKYYNKNWHSKKNVVRVLEKAWLSEHVLVNSMFDQLQKETGLSGDFICRWFDWKNVQQGVETVLSGLIEKHYYLKLKVLNSLSSLFRISQKKLEICCMKTRAEKMIFKSNEHQLETNLMKKFLLHRQETNKYGLIQKLSFLFDLSVEDIVHIFNCWSKFGSNESLINSKSLSLFPQTFNNVQEQPSSQFLLDFQRSKRNQKEGSRFDPYFKQLEKSFSMIEKNRYQAAQDPRKISFTSFLSNTPEKSLHGITAANSAQLSVRIPIQNKPPTPAVESTVLGPRQLQKPVQSAETPIKPVEVPVERVGTPVVRMELPVEPVGTPVVRMELPVKTPVERVETPALRVETPVEPVRTPVVRMELPVERVETPVLRVKTPVVPVRTPAVRMELPVERVETPVVRMELPVEQVETPVEPVETPVVPVRTPVERVETPVVPVRTPVVRMELPVLRVKTLVEQVETPVERVETPALRVETPVVPVRTPVVRMELPVERVETPVEPAETPFVRVKSPVERVKTPVERVETPVEPVETPVVRMELPVVRMELPVERVETPVEPAETPAKATVAFPRKVSCTTLKKVEERKRPSREDPSSFPSSNIFCLIPEKQQRLTSELLGFEVFPFSKLINNFCKAPHGRQIINSTQNLKAVAESLNNRCLKTQVEESSASEPLSSFIVPQTVVENLEVKEEVDCDGASSSSQVKPEQYPISYYWKKS